MGQRGGTLVSAPDNGGIKAAAGGVGGAAWLGAAMPELRIHFTAEDLARTRVAAGTDLLWELVLSMHVLRARHVPARYTAWRQEARARLAADPRPPRARLVADLIPPVGAFPDFLTPPPAAGGQRSLAVAVEHVAATPARRLNKDLAAVFTRRAPSAWVRDLAAGRPAPMRALAGALRSYYHVAMTGHVHQIADAVHADRALRARHFLDGGIDKLLAMLPPPIQWSRPVLTTAYARDRDIQLRGTGITIIPSYFCHRHPVTLIDPELPPVLVYPAVDPAGPASSPALGALLGHTRAHALAAARTPCSTSELAARLHTSIGTASKHASTLRDAGLLTSTRHGGTVLHALTPLGTALLGH